MQLGKRLLVNGQSLDILCPGTVKNTEKDRKLKDFYFQAFVKQVNDLAHFSD